jgi:hypothetical protein
MILWSMLHRAQEDMAIAFLEESWSQKLPEPVRDAAHPWSTSWRRRSSARSRCPGRLAVQRAGRLFYGLRALGDRPDAARRDPRAGAVGWAIGLVTVGLMLRYGAGWTCWPGASRSCSSDVCAVYPLQVCRRPCRSSPACSPPTSSKRSAPPRPAPRTRELLIGWSAGLIAHGLALVFLDAA